MKNTIKAIAWFAVWLAALYLAARVNTDRGILVVFWDASIVGVAVLAVRWNRQRKESKLSRKF